jgi:hypothetical protein
MIDLWKFRRDFQGVAAFPMTEIETVFSSHYTNRPIPADIVNYVLALYVINVIDTEYYILTALFSQLLYPKI